jgi:hypothetical protein
MDLNFNDVCRLCARKCEDMQNIFQDISAESESFMDVTKDMSGMLPCKIAAATSIKVRLSLLKKMLQASRVWLCLRVRALQRLTGTYRITGFSDFVHRPDSK